MVRNPGLQCSAARTPIAGRVNWSQAIAHRFFVLELPLTFIPSSAEPQLHALNNLRAKPKVFWLCLCLCLPRAGTELLGIIPSDVWAPGKMECWKSRLCQGWGQTQNAIFVPQTLPTLPGAAVSWGEGGNSSEPFPFGFCPPGCVLFCPQDSQGWDCAVMPQPPWQGRFRSLVNKIQITAGTINVFQASSALSALPPCWAWFCWWGDKQEYNRIFLLKFPWRFLFQLDRHPALPAHHLSQPQLFQSCSALVEKRWDGVPCMGCGAWTTWEHQIQEFLSPELSTPSRCALLLHWSPGLAEEMFSTQINS